MQWQSMFYTISNFIVHLNENFHLPKVKSVTVISCGFEDEASENANHTPFKYSWGKTKK